MEGFGARADRSQARVCHANSPAQNDNNLAYDGLGRETAFARGLLSASGNNSATLDAVSAATQSQTWNMDALGNWGGPTTNGTAQTRNFNSQNRFRGAAGAVAGGSEAPANAPFALHGSGVAAGTVKYLYYSNNWQVLETRRNGTASADVAHQYLWSQMYIDAMVLRDT